MNDNWFEIVETLQSAREKFSTTEQGYQHEIEACLKMLGWKTSNRTMRSQYSINYGSCNSIRPDIVLFKDEKHVLPIEIKKPSNQFNQRQAEQLISYMRQLKLNVGLFIGENIQVYYDNPQGKEIAESVFTAEIEKNDSNGSTICDLLCYDKFTVENIEKFCQEQYQYKLGQKNLQQRFSALLSNGEAIKNLIKEKFLQEGFEEKALEEELSKISVDVRQRDMVDSSFHAYKGIPIRIQGHNKEFTYQGTTYWNKRKFVLSFIKEYVLNHAGISFSELKKQFPDELGQSRSLGVVRLLTVIENQSRMRPDLIKRYFLRQEEIIKLDDGTKVVVCNQWGDAFLKFLNHIQTSLS